MFPIAAFTDEFSQDFDYALDVLLEYGVRLAELRGLWGKNISVMSPEDLERAKLAMERRGVSAVSIGSPGYKCTLPKSPAEADEQLDVIRRCCKAARFLGADLVRVFAFLPNDENPELTPEIWDRITEAYLRAVEVAAEEKVVLGLENEHACYIGTGAQTAELLRRVDSEWLGVVWDPGNAFFCGEESFPDGYEAVRGKIIHVHVKDAARDPATGRARWLPAGEGELDFPRLFRALKADGYGGALSLEPHYKPEGGTAEDGSRACLEGLLRILKTEVS